MGTSVIGADQAAAIVVNEAGRSPFLFVCEHASNFVPARLKGLGLPPEELERHIAHDIGAEALSRRLADALDAPLVLQRYSRLIYDCNRPPKSPGAMPVVSETTAIPGNQNLSDDEKAARIAEIYRPFHARIAKLIDRRMKTLGAPVIVTIHSFTPVYKGRRRHLDFGVLHDQDARLADAILAGASRWRDVITRRNEPYGPADGVCHTLNMHAGERGLPGVMLEIRNDLIADTAGKAAWAARLADVLEAAILPQGGTIVYSPES